MIYEARVQLKDGRDVIGLVDAEDKDDAKWEFAHSPVMTISGDVVYVKNVDYRTVKLSKNQVEATASL